jgi:tol-pal system protein YbgF
MAGPGTPGALPGASTATQEAPPAVRPGAGGATQLSGDEGRDFNTARDLLLRGEFARAGEMFGAIVKAYPKSKLAGDSQFWKAESLFVRELYRDAAEAYLVVARDFPDSAKAPDSLVKLSLSFDKLGQRKQACAALSQLDRRYPKAPEKVRQNAERIKEEFACA